MFYDIHGNPINALYDMDGNPVTPLSKKPLRIMTYNVGGWYDGTGQNVPSAKDPAYYQLQYGTIADANPDILFINEYWDQFSKTGRTALSILSDFFPYIEAHHGTETVLGRCVCSKFPLSNYTERLFNAGEPDARFYDTVEANIDGRTVTLCMTFFWWNDTDIRKAEAEILIPFLQSLDTPFICAGDINTGRAVDLTNVIQPMVNAGFIVTNRATFGSYVTYMDTIGSGGYGSVDNIIFSPDFTVEKIWVDKRKLTDGITTETVDHMPLIVEAGF